MERRRSVVLRVISLTVSLFATVVTRDDGTVVNLPVTDIQLEELREAVCADIAMDETTLSSCREKFFSIDRSLLAEPSSIDIKCQGPELVTFKIPPSEHWQLVALVPDANTLDPTIHYILIQPNQILAKLAAPANNYTIWTTALTVQGIPSIWREGQKVQVRNEALAATETQMYHVETKYNYKKGDSTVDVEVSWNKADETDSCFCVVNQCNTSLKEKNIGPDDQSRLTLYGVGLNENCIISITGATGITNASYHTPSCHELEGCESIPEIPKIVTIKSYQTSPGWRVAVGWVKPRHDPDYYNITLRADEIYQMEAPGNATEVIFTDVEGSGLYNVSVIAITTKAKSHTTRRAIFPMRVEESSMSVMMVGAWSAVLIFAGAFVGVVFCCHRRRKQRTRLYFSGPEYKSGKECEIELSGSECSDDRWEVRAERLRLHEAIGEGAFGVVRRGTLLPTGKEVAVKMLKDFPTVEEVRSFRSEIELMKSVGWHPHVARLVGCCSGRRPLILSEYCARGDLLTYLRHSWDMMVSKRNAKYYNNNIEISDYRGNQKTNKEQLKLVVNKVYELEGDPELTSVDLLSFCRQIAKGMKFLASNRVVHRDLAARNILVSGDKTLKITDFGLSRDIYQENHYKQKGNGKMPVKWMALESLTHRIFTSQSDVWSFGVVMWEIVTVGGAPYGEVPAARLPRLLRAGYRMPRPNNCSKQLYELMVSCWHARPRERPTFTQLHRDLDALLNGACADTYLSLELDPPTETTPHRYFKLLSRAKLGWTCGESYERPFKAQQENHYTSSPATSPQIV